MESEIIELSQDLGRLLRKSGAKVTVAESCTGGGIASAITEVEGSSQWFQVGFVTYSDRYKKELLDVPQTLLTRDGAVSESVVRRMVDGAVTIAKADFGIAVSGIAGPSGGSEDKPVGTVWFAWRGGSSVGAASKIFLGGRTAVRQQAIKFSLQQLLHMVKE